MFSRRGVTHLLEAKAHPPTKAIPRFIQMNLPLLLLKPMAQLRHGVTQRSLKQGYVAPRLKPLQHKFYDRFLELFTDLFPSTQFFSLLC
jgi:hypothetical protein